MSIRTIARPTAALTRSTGGTSSSSAIDLTGASKFSVQALIAVTSPVGLTFTVEGSNDGTTWYGLSPNNTVDGGNWSNTSGAFSVPITVNTTLLLEFDANCYYARTSLTQTSGTVTATSTFNIIGENS